MTWHDFEAPPGREGLRGSEGGHIVLDQERAEGARITLERDTQSAPFAITCGVYGWLVHTRSFGDEATARQEFAQMRDGLDIVLAAIPLETEMENETKLSAAFAAVSAFVDLFP